MSGELITFLLCFVVILVAGNSYRRRGGSQAPTNPRAMMAIAIGLAVLALIGAGLLYMRRHVG